MSNFSFSRNADNVVIKYSKQAAGIGVSLGMEGKPTMFSGTTAAVPNSHFANGSVYMIGAYSAADGSGSPIDTDWYIADPGAKVQIPAASPGGSLVDLCAASLANNDPRPGCEGAKALHDKWLAFLDAAFPAGGVMAKDNANALATMKEGLTSCSSTLGNCFRNFGVPNGDYAKTGGDSVVPYSGSGKYERKVAPGTLPKVGDPYIIGPNANIKDNHHAFFGPVTSQKPFQFLSYAGGQATLSSSAKIPDANRYPCTLNPNGTTGVEVGNRALLFFVDMWAWLNDHGSQLKPTGKMNLM